MDEGLSGDRRRRRRRKEKEEEEEEEEQERVERKISDEKEIIYEGEVRTNEAKVKTVDEKGPAVAKEVVEKDERGGEESLKSQTAIEQKDKEPSKKAAISSFFGEEEFAYLCACTKKKMFINVLSSVWKDSKILFCPNPCSWLTYLVITLFVLNSPQKSCCKNRETSQE